MRFILFYSGIESFNFFTDEINSELMRLHHETFILDLKDVAGAPGHSLKDMLVFTKFRVDAVIGYDQMPCIGTSYVDLWNDLDIPVISVFMDPPFRFGSYNVNLPKKYLRFCCDIEHVTWCKRFHSDTIPNVYFLPHAASEPDFPPPSWEDKKYDILFSGTYYSPNSYIKTIKEKYDETTKSILLDTIDFMKAYTSYSFTAAVDRILSGKGYNADDQVRLSLMNQGEEADWYIRMLYREKMIKEVLLSGRDLWILGRGWENFPDVNNGKLHHISDRVGFAESLGIMEQARINLNIMPWYKDGTHDRIFNSLLRNSIPLTDPSLFLKEHFKNGESIVYYDLNSLHAIPDLISSILDDPVKSQCIIEKGKQIVLEHFTWTTIVKELISAAASFKA